MNQGASKLLVALVVGLAATLLVFVLSRTAGTQAEGDGPTVQTTIYMIGTLILVSAGNWAILSRMSLAQYVRNIGIWLVIGALAFGLYYLLYPGGR
jgi:heme/copper-type cytochrome/quinol oxidase subunit 3